MYFSAEKEELSQISLTGVRGLILFGLLLNAPRTLKEIKDKFIEFNLMEEQNSSDIIRIDINTLRAIGCKISRASKKTDNKYVLIDYPFSMKIDENEINLIKSAYNHIKNTLSLAAIWEYDKLFKKLASRVTDPKTKELLLGISLLKSSNTELIEELIKDCKYNRIIKLLYQPPYAKAPEEKEISLKEVVIKNDKTYLYGFDINLKEAVTLNIKRIKEILSKKDSNKEYEINPIVIKFLLKEFGTTGLIESEKILEKNPDGYIIEGRYHNAFIAKQRILSFGSTCQILEPEDFKKSIIDILKQMKEIYNG